MIRGGVEYASGLQRGRANLCRWGYKTRELQKAQSPCCEEFCLGKTALVFGRSSVRVFSHSVRVRVEVRTDHLQGHDTENGS